MIQVRSDKHQGYGYGSSSERCGWADVGGQWAWEGQVWAEDSGRALFLDLLNWECLCTTEVKKDVTGAQQGWNCEYICGGTCPDMEVKPLE